MRFCFSFRICCIQSMGTMLKIKTTKPIIIKRQPSVSVHKLHYIKRKKEFECRLSFFLIIMDWFCFRCDRENLQI